MWLLQRTVSPPAKKSNCQIHRSLQHASTEPAYVTPTAFATVASFATASPSVALSSRSLLVTEGTAVPLA